MEHTLTLQDDGSTFQSASIVAPVVITSSHRSRCFSFKFHPALNEKTSSTFTHLSKRDFLVCVVPAVTRFTDSLQSGMFNPDDSPLANHAL